LVDASSAPQADRKGAGQEAAVPDAHLAAHFPVRFTIARRRHRIPPSETAARQKTLQKEL